MAVPYFSNPKKYKTVIKRPPYVVEDFLCPVSIIINRIVHHSSFWTYSGYDGMFNGLVDSSEYSLRTLHCPRSKSYYFDFYVEEESILYFHTCSWQNVAFTLRLNTFNGPAISCADSIAPNRWCRVLYTLQPFVHYIFRVDYWVMSELAVFGHGHRFLVEDNSKIMKRDTSWVEV